MTSPQVQVLVPQLLAEHFGGQKQRSFDSAEMSCLADLLERVASDYPVLDRRIRDETGQLRRFVNCYLNGEDVRLLAGLQTPLGDGDEVQFLQSVAGG